MTVRSLIFYNKFKKFDKSEFSENFVKVNWLNGGKGHFIKSMKLNLDATQNFYRVSSEKIKIYIFRSGIIYILHMYICMYLYNSLYLHILYNIKCAFIQG